MCSGHITRYSCGHEKRTYYYECPDGSNEHRQELLPHRMVGPRFRTTRLCGDCERDRLDQEEDEVDDRQEHEVRAKALLEFFRGERPWPLPDAEVIRNFTNAYSVGNRLHPWMNRGNEPGLDMHRALFIQSFPDAGPALFQEMLDRQAEIDQTGIILDDDMRYRFDTLIEQGTAEVRRRRDAEQDVWEELGRRQQAVQDELNNREQNLRDREPFLILGGERAQTIQEEERTRLQQVARPMEQIRELQLALYQPSDIEELAREHRILEEALALRRQALVDGYPILYATEQFFGERDQAIRDTREEGEANRERSLELQLQNDQFLARWRGLAQLRVEIIQEPRDRDQNMEDIRQRGPVIQQDAPQVEQLNGLYESDPDWLLNFDDWCNDNSTFESASPEIDLRQDINGWFQHLCTCQSQARLDWIPIAETYRDAILEGDRHGYEYVPDPDAPGSERLLSFRNWCLENADPAEIRISPINSTFINLLRGYADYLISADALRVLVNFQYDRQGRVQIIRDHLAAIPGAPMSRDLSNPSMMENTPRNWQMCADIGRITREGGLTTEADIQQRHAQFARFQRLRDEAIAVHEGRLPSFRIERDEREARAKEERARQAREEEEIDDDDEGFFIIPLTRRVHNVRGRAASEEREERYRVAQEQQDESDTNRGFSFTIGIPATIQSAIDELHSSGPLPHHSDEYWSRPAERAHDDWQMAAALVRAERRARREAEDEALRENESEDESEEELEGEAEEREAPAETGIQHFRFPGRFFR